MARIAELLESLQLIILLRLDGSLPAHRIWELLSVLPLYIAPTMELDQLRSVLSLPLEN